VLAVGQHYPSDRDFVHLPDGLPDHGERVMAYLAIRPQAEGARQVTGIDLAAIDELVDFNRARGLQRDILELLHRHREGAGTQVDGPCPLSAQIRTGASFNPSFSLGTMNRVRKPALSQSTLCASNGSRAGIGSHFECMKLRLTASGDRVDIIEIVPTRLLYPNIAS
jgi:hypothetical protein